METEITLDEIVERKDARIMKELEIGYLKQQVDMECHRMLATLFRDYDVVITEATKIIDEGGLRMWSGSDFRALLQYKDPEGYSFFLLPPCLYGLVISYAWGVPILNGTLFFQSLKVQSDCIYLMNINESKVECRAAYKGVSV